MSRSSSSSSSLWGSYPSQFAPSSSSSYSSFTYHSPSSSPSSSLPLPSSFSSNSPSSSSSPSKFSLSTLIISFCSFLFFLFKRPKLLILSTFSILLLFVAIFVWTKEDFSTTTTTSPSSPLFSQSNVELNANPNKDTISPLSTSPSPSLSPSSTLPKHRLSNPNNIIDLNPPLTRPSLGHASWALLHTMASLYPIDPSPTRQQEASSFLLSLSHLYPCSVCGKHMEEYFLAHPIQVSTRDHFVSYLCEFHNDVNKRLGKDIQSCELKVLYEMWPPALFEDCGCEIDKVTEGDVGVMEREKEKEKGKEKEVEGEKEDENDSQHRESDKETGDISHDNNDHDNDHSDSPDDLSDVLSQNKEGEKKAKRLLSALNRIKEKEQNQEKEKDRAER